MVIVHVAFLILRKLVFVSFLFCFLFSIVEKILNDQMWSNWMVNRYIHQAQPQVWRLLGNRLHHGAIRVAQILYSGCIHDGEGMYILNLLDCVVIHFGTFLNCSVVWYVKLVIVVVCACFKISSTSLSW